MARIDPGDHDRLAALQRLADQIQGMLGPGMQTIGIDLDPGFHILLEGGKNNPGGRALADLIGCFGNRGSRVGQLFRLDDANTQLVELGGSRQHRPQFLVKPGGFNRRRGLGCQERHQGFVVFAKGNIFQLAKNQDSPN